MWAFVWSPVRFFETRLERPPSWPLALAAPILCGVLDVCAILAMAAKTQPAFNQIA